MKLEAFGDGWKFAAAGCRQSAWRLSDTRRGEDILLINWAKLNGCSEADALSEKCRFHSKLDNAEAVVESLNVYPFGGESSIERTLSLRGKLAEIKIDIKPGRGEFVRDLELEELFFPGEFAKLEILRSIPAPGGEWQLETLPANAGTAYAEDKPFALLLLTDADGFQIELGSGGDWWRTLGAGKVFWSIEIIPDGVAVKRQVIALADEEITERRPWRFNYYIAWGRNSAMRMLPDKEDTVLSPDLVKEVKCDCFRAPAVRKYLRKQLRHYQSDSGNVVLQLPAVKSCDDAGHLERPGKKSLRHWDLDELFAFYSWGNRTLGEGRTFTIQMPPESLFSKLPSGRYLANAPSLATVREL